MYEEFQKKTTTLYDELRNKYDVVLLIAQRYQQYQVLPYLSVKRTISSEQLVSFINNLAYTLLDGSCRSRVFGDSPEIADHALDLLRGETWGLLAVVRDHDGTMLGMYCPPKAAPDEPSEVDAGPFPAPHEILFDFLAETYDISQFTRAKLDVGERDAKAAHHE